MGCNYPIDIVNDPLSALGAYLKTKGFGLALVSTGYLIGPGRLFKKIKNKNTKKCQATKFLQKSQNSFQIRSKINYKNPAFPFVQISAQL